MKKNNFFIALVAMLFGIYFETRSSEGLAIVGVVGGVALMATIKTIKSTATYQTYSHHQDRLVLEQEKSDNLLLHAQRVSIKGSEALLPETSMEERVRLFEDNYKKEQVIFSKRFEPVIKKRPSTKIKIIDDYKG
jgi:hypothetical protein